jgi:hypothetical protein
VWISSLRKLKAEVCRNKNWRCYYENHGNNSTTATVYLLILGSKSEYYKIPLTAATVKLWQVQWSMDESLELGWIVIQYLH